MSENQITHFNIGDLVRRQITPLVPIDVENDKIPIEGLEFEEVELCSWSDIVEKIREQKEIVWIEFATHSTIESDKVRREAIKNDNLSDKEKQERYIAKFEEMTKRCISNLLIFFAQNLGHTIATIICMVGCEHEYIFYSKPLEPRNEKYGEMDGVTHLITLFKNGLYVNVDCMQYVWDYQYTARILLGIRVIDPLSELTN
jgi:hypothetical protein